MSTIERPESLKTMQVWNQVGGKWGDLVRYALQLEQRVRLLETSPDIAGLSVLADIREVLGVDMNPMLSELPGIVRLLMQHIKELEQHNVALRKMAEAAEERGGCFVEQALQAARKAGALKEGE